MNQDILKELRKVYGDPIPMFVAVNPYGGGTSYYDEDHNLRDSGFFEFDTEAELDEFIGMNRHCHYLKVGDAIY
jgi:hypothetical protein